MQIFQLKLLGLEVTSKIVVLHATLYYWHWTYFAHKI